MRSVFPAWMLFALMYPPLWGLTLRPIQAQNSQPVLISYMMPTTVTQGEPVVVDMVADNPLPTAVRVDLGMDDETDLSFTQIPPGGVATTVRPKQHDGVSFRGKDVDPLGRFVHKIVLNRWFAFTALGTYRLKIDFLGSVKTITGASVDARSTGEFSFTLLPRDEKTLRQTCESLVRQVEGTTNVSLQNQSLQALEYVNDPVVIPCLTGAVRRNGWLAPVLALEHIGGPEARAALEELSLSSDSSIAAYAKASLTRIR